MTATKGELTRERIVASAASLFNRRGYAGASMTDLMAAAGLEKGGVYRHFDSKQAIATAAFDHAAKLHGDRIRAHLAVAPPDAASRMVAVAAGMASIAVDPPIPGGCPLLNTAIESDDADGDVYPALRARAKHGMRRLLGTIEKIVAEGVVSGEFRPDANARVEASGVVSMMEGALMLTKLNDDPAHLAWAVERVRERAHQLSVAER